MTSINYEDLIINTNIDFLNKKYNIDNVDNVKKYIDKQKSFKDKMKSLIDLINCKDDKDFSDKIK
jgi:hypothetical protein